MHKDKTERPNSILTHLHSILSSKLVAGPDSQGNCEVGVNRGSAMSDLVQKHDPQ